jgi:hypothetical protein
MEGHDMAAKSESEILESFNSSVPDEFCRQVLRRGFGGYQAANLRCSEFPLNEKHDLLPHVRRALFESDLRSIAKQFHFTASAELNKTKNSYHTMVLAGQIALTASAVPSPDIIVRPAKFRGVLAATSQMNLYNEEEEEEGYIYGIIIHGPNEDKPFQPGFCRIVFPDRNVEAYVYEIDLFSKYQALVTELQTGRVELIGDEVWPELRRDIPQQQNSDL